MKSTAKFGRLITLEGVDGSGKTTQGHLIQKYFLEKGIQSTIVREPGGTDISEKIRSVILDSKNSTMDRLTEMFLYAAARSQLVHEVIKPRLENNEVVICDRFLDSSLVYQGIARKIGIDTVYQINNIALNGLLPDLTIFFDIAPEDSFKRLSSRSETDRMEKEKLEFHQMVYDGYKILVKKFPDRIKTVDATLGIDEIFEHIKSLLENI